MLSSKEIGKKIKEIRILQKEQTQEQFAESIGSSKETVSNIERGCVVPSTKTLANIAEYSGASINQILGIEENNS